MDPNLPDYLADLTAQFRETAQRHAAERDLLAALIGRAGEALCPEPGRVLFAAPVPPSNPNTPGAGLVGLTRYQSAGALQVFPLTSTGVRRFPQLTDAELLGVARAAGDALAQARP